MKHYTDYSLKSHHTFGMDVCASHFVEYASVEELQMLLVRLHSEWSSLPWIHIGGGSNLLFSSDYYRGVVLHSAIDGWEIVAEDDNVVHLRVGAGVVWDDLVAYAVSKDWGGIENLSLIPGEVGASAVQNIGAYGVEAKDVIVSVEAVHVDTQEHRIFSREECLYAYRKSVFKEELKGKYVITHVTYRLQKQHLFRLDYGNIRVELERMGEGVSLGTVRRAVIAIRESKLPDPKVLGNAGSFFMNPIVPRVQMEQIRKDYPQMPYYDVDVNYVKIPAGWMIEQCGWKGKSMGRAGVHNRQALVLVNLGGATGIEVMALSNAVRHSVKERFGVEIHPEVNLIE